MYFQSWNNAEIENGMEMVTAGFNFHSSDHDHKSNILWFCAASVCWNTKQFSQTDKNTNLFVFILYYCKDQVDLDISMAIGKKITTATNNKWQANDEKCINTMNEWRLTLDDEVDMCSAWLGSRLKAARVWTLIGHGHLLNLDGEITVVVVGHWHSRVQRPLLVPCEQDVGAVQPGLVGHFLVDLTPVRQWIHKKHVVAGCSL